MFDEFDRDLVRNFYEAMLRGEDHVFRDPAYRYQVTVKKDGEAYSIVLEDTSKKWWGRVLEKKRVSVKPVMGSMTQGPAFEALWVLKHRIDADRGLAEQEAALKKR